MKNLLLLLLLGSVPAFGQAYSSSVTQNSPGNYGRPVPYAQVVICSVSDTATPCTQKSQTYNNQILQTACTLNSSSGVLTGAPTSGANCNNPGIADANGNFTIYVIPGQYRVCTYAQNWLCQNVSVGGGGSGSPFLFRTNSPLGTTLYQLVTYDKAHLDSNSVATVQNAPLGSNVGVIGVCIANCGTSGIATIATYLSTSCVMDGTGVVGNVVTSSNSVGGFCHDEGTTTDQSGVQTIGRISKANSGGGGTTAQVDFFLGDIIGSGGTGLVSNPNCVGTPIAYYPSGLVASVQGDCFTALDGAGHGQMKGIGLTDTSTAGFLYQTQGTQPTLAASNSIYHFAPTSVPTTYGFQWPSATGTGCLFGTPSGSVVTLSFQNPCGGGGGFPVSTANNPGQPTVTPGGTPGAATYTYGVIGCQDPNCVYHSKISTLGTTTTGNATLSSTNYNELTAYGDTTPYGYRGYLMCRTAGGTTQGIITNNLLVGKKFRDTGLAGDSTNCASAYSTNTTILAPLCLGSAVPGSPTTPGFPCGVDGPPLTFTAYDDEMGPSFGAPGDVNNSFWTWGNQQGATAAWSGGTIVLTTDGTAQAEYLVLNANAAFPSTPFTFEVWIDALSNNASANLQSCFVGLRESATGKIWGVGFDSTQTDNSGANLTGWRWEVNNFTSNSAWTSHWFRSYMPPDGYVKIQDTGSSLNASYSETGNGVAFHQFDTETIATAFTTAPNQIIIGGLPQSGVPATCTFDFIRKTQ